MARIRIYADESVNVAIAEGLKRRGLDVLSARDTGNLGLTDEKQMLFAEEEKAAIFTHDTDFLRLAAKWLGKQRTHYGVIYCHQKDYSVGECVRRLKFLTTMLTSEDMINHIEFL